MVRLNLERLQMKEFNQDLLKPGDKILFHTKGFSPISMGIRHLTKSFWNHASQYEVEDGIGYVIEAIGIGVVKTPIDKYIDNKSYILKAVRLKESAFASIEEYIKGLETSKHRIYDRIGTKYDYFGILWLGCKYIIKGWFRKAPINFFQDREKFFCSELLCSVDYGISSIHPFLYQGKTKQRCGTCTPKDVGKSEHVKYICGSRLG